MSTRFHPNFWMNQNQMIKTFPKGGFAGPLLKNLLGTPHVHKIWNEKVVSVDDSIQKRSIVIGKCTPNENHDASAELTCLL